MCFPIQPVKTRHGIVADMKSRLIGAVKWIKLTILFVLLASAIGKCTRHVYVCVYLLSVCFVKIAFAEMAVELFKLGFITLFDIVF